MTVREAAPPIEALLLRSRILAWRDKHLEAIDNHLNRELTVLFGAIDQALERPSFNEILLRQKSLAKEYIEPLYHEWLTREVGHLLNQAQSDLQSICSRVLEFCDTCFELQHAAGTGHYADVVKAAAGIGGGLVAVPVFSSMATVSAGGLLGFLGLTAISWPVALTGIAVASGLLAYGGQQAANLKHSLVTRFRDRIQESISKQVLGAEDFPHSARQTLHDHIASTANGILREIDQC